MIAMAGMDRVYVMLAIRVIIRGTVILFQKETIKEGG
jgi:hypothetical protein